MSQPQQIEKLYSHSLSLLRPLFFATDHKRYEEVLNNYLSLLKEFLNHEKTEIGFNDFILHNLNEVFISRLAHAKNITDHIFACGKSIQEHEDYTKKTLTGEGLKEWSKDNPNQPLIVYPKIVNKIVAEKFWKYQKLEKIHNWQENKQPFTNQDIASLVNLKDIAVSIQNLINSRKQSIKQYNEALTTIIELIVLS